MSGIVDPILLVQSVERLRREEILVKDLVKVPGVNTVSADTGSGYRMQERVPVGQLGDKRALYMKEGVAGVAG